METLRCMPGAVNVEVYSVDEAFFEPQRFEDGFKEEDMNELGLKLRHTIEQWTGIKVSVGIANQPRSASKVANHLAKEKNKGNTMRGCARYPIKIEEALQKHR